MNETDPAIALTDCWKLATSAPIQSGLMTGRSSKLKENHHQQLLGTLTTDTAVKIADLAVEESVVAAGDDDASFDYYLLKVKSNGVEELAENTTLDYGSIYTEGENTSFSERT